MPTVTYTMNIVSNINSYDITSASDDNIIQFSNYTTDYKSTTSSSCTVLSTSIDFLPARSHLLHYLRLTEKQLFYFFIIYYVLAAFTMIGLTLFSYLLVNRRLSSSNRCFFVHNVAYMSFTNIMQIFYTCFFHDAPFIYAANKNSNDIFAIPMIRWSTAALVMLIGQFSFYITAFAKIISLTFKRRHQHEVWNEKVAIVAFFISLGFPLLFVGSYMLENPRNLTLLKSDFCNSAGIAALIDYNNLRILICSLGLTTVILGLILALMKKLYSTEIVTLFRRIQPPIIRTLTADSDYQPTTTISRPFRVSLRSMDVHYGFILLLYGCLMLFEVFYIENGFPYYSPYEILLNLIRAASFPIMTLIYHAIPLLIELIHYIFQPCSEPHLRKRSVLRSGDILVLSPFGLMPRQNETPAYEETDQIRNSQTTRI